MKKSRNILTLVLVAGALMVFAKSVTQKIKVNGNCEMCKEKIEKALDIPGISFAEWSMETKMLTVRYNDSKVTEDKIHDIISGLGYSTEKKEADKTAQSKLDKCCQPKTKAKSCCSSKASCEKK